jgi:hypothetical protein
MRKRLREQITSIICISCNKQTDRNRFPDKITISKETLMDKIKGGWAGQVIGCTTYNKKQTIPAKFAGTVQMNNLNLNIYFYIILHNSALIH